MHIITYAIRVYAKIIFLAEFRLRLVVIEINCLTIYCWFDFDSCLEFKMGHLVRLVLAQYNTSEHTETYCNQFVHQLGSRL